MDTVLRSATPPAAVAVGSAALTAEPTATGAGPTGVVFDGATHDGRHRGLLMRVAGYGDVFRDRRRELQDEIIARTEHAGA